jgi:hypothetical protein
MQDMLIPPVVTVFPVVVELKISCPECVHTVPELSVIEPLTTKFPVPAKVIPDTETVMLKQRDGAPLIVTVNGVVPEPLLKNTESVAVGADAPLAPPGEADQFAVDAVFHVPEPPTQYLSAIKPSF